MKPYGQEGSIKGGNSWKKDYRMHSRNRKVKNWWEDIKDPLSRSAQRQEILKSLDISEGNYIL